MLPAYTRRVITRPAIVTQYHPSDSTKLHKKYNGFICAFEMKTGCELNFLAIVFKDNQLRFYEQLVSFTNTPSVASPRIDFESKSTFALRFTKNFSIGELPPRFLERAQFNNFFSIPTRFHEDVHQQMISNYLPTCVAIASIPIHIGETELAGYKLQSKNIYMRQIILILGNTDRKSPLSTLPKELINSILTAGIFHHLRNAPGPLQPHWEDRKDKGIF